MAPRGSVGRAEAEEEVSMRFLGRPAAAAALVLAGVVLPAGGADTPEPCTGVVGHHELRACWTREVERASAEMDRTYAALLRKLPRHAAASLRKAQKLWLQFRDAHVATLYGVDDPAATFGPDYPICIAISRYVMTRDRTKELRGLLDPDPATICPL
jgi:uncharacterized protein YecT (DUF1311 family)